MFYLFYKDQSSNKPFWNHFASADTFEVASEIKEEETTRGCEVLIMCGNDKLYTMAFKELDSDDWYEGEDGEVYLK